MKFVLITEKTLIKCVYCPVTYFQLYVFSVPLYLFLRWMDTQQLPLIWLRVIRHLDLKGTVFMA
jgi:hypothetical protein